MQITLNARRNDVIYIISDLGADSQGVLMKTKTRRIIARARNKRIRKPDRWSHALASKPKIDIEHLLTWTYRDQCVLSAVGGVVEPAIAGSRAVKRFIVHPDATVVHQHVLRLPVHVRLAIIRHACEASAPEWRAGFADATMNEILRHGYMRWWESLLALSHSLRADAPRLSEHWVHAPERDPLPWFSDREKVSNHYFQELVRACHWPPAFSPMEAANDDSAHIAVNHWRRGQRERCANGH